MVNKKFIAVLSMVLFGSTAIMAQTYNYIGAAKCKMCHNKVATGQQYKIWSESTHAKAMESLSSEKSLNYAKEHGIADPTKEKSCIECHSTYYSINQDNNIGVTAAEGVSCETCHGPGSAYKTNAIMNDQAKSIANGLIVPDKKLCETCHNSKNPFHKTFNYEEYSKKISHPIPATE
jgi:hypothetical protein